MFAVVLLGIIALPPALNIRDGFPKEFVVVVPAVTPPLNVLAVLSLYDDTVALIARLFEL